MITCSFIDWKLTSRILSTTSQAGEHFKVCWSGTAGKNVGTWARSELPSSRKEGALCNIPRGVGKGYNISATSWITERHLWHSAHKQPWWQCVCKGDIKVSEVIKGRYKRKLWTFQCAQHIASIDKSSPLNKQGRVWDIIALWNCWDEVRPTNLQQFPFAFVTTGWSRSRTKKKGP